MASHYTHMLRYSFMLDIKDISTINSYNYDHTEDTDDERH
jgi:hypothetical protein